jgi:ABC-type uncharacterized transport systems, ATPase components
LRTPQQGNITVCGTPTAGHGARGGAASRLGICSRGSTWHGLGAFDVDQRQPAVDARTQFFGGSQSALLEAETFIKQLEIKTPGPLTPTRKLSGGNAQKVLLARELFAVSGARVLVVCSPTRGLDVGAVETVHALLDEARDAGKAILLVSEDLDEVMTLADRVMVLYRGRITLEQSGLDTNVDRVGQAMAGIAT